MIDGGDRDAVFIDGGGGDAPTEQYRKYREKEILHLGGDYTS